MIKLRIGVKHLFQESIAAFKNPVPFVPSDSSLKKNKHGHIIEVIPKFLNETIDNKHIETKLSKVSSIKHKLTNISSSFFNYEDITPEKASIAALSQSISNYNANTALSKRKSDFKEFKKVLPLLTCTVPCNGSVIAANTLNEEQYLHLSNDDVKVIIQDIHKHKCKYLEMMNLIPAQQQQQPKVDMTFEVIEGCSYKDKGNAFYNINDINAHEDVTQQLGNFKLFNNSNNNNTNKRNNVQSERSAVFQKQQLTYMQGNVNVNVNERQSMKVNKVVPKTFEMDPYSQQSSKTNVSMYNYNVKQQQQPQQQMKPKTMSVNPYASNNDNTFIQQQHLPYTNYYNNNIQQLNTTQAPYQAYSYNQQERIDFNKFKQNLFFPHERHTNTNSNVSSSSSSSYNEFRRLINNINISDNEIAKYLNEYTDNVSIAAERYFQSKYNTPELTLQYIYSQTFRKTHTFSFLARVDELFLQVNMDMPSIPHYKLLFQNGMEITKEMLTSFKCIGALDIKNNSFIYIHPL